MRKIQSYTEYDKSNNVHTFTVYDESTNTYTMSLLEKGGPIISGGDLDEVKSEFYRALNVAVSIVKLVNFDKNGRS